MSKENREKNEQRAGVRAPMWRAVIDGALLVTLFLLAGVITPVASERLYLVWPVVFVFDVALFGTGWRPAGLIVLAIIAGGAILDVTARPAPVLPGEVMRVGWCLGGWTALLITMHALFVMVWCAAGGRREGLLPRAMWLAVLIAMIIPATMSYLQIHPVRWHGSFDPSFLRPPLAFEEVSFQSRDGSRLAGWFIPAPGSRRTAVLVHGVMDHKGGMSSFLPMLHGGGYNVLLFDLRGHGLSERWTVTYGAREQEDIIAAVDFAKTFHPEAAEHVVGVAWSMGAAAMILAAAADERIEAVHLDAPYASTADMARHIGEPMPRLVAWWTYWMGTTLASAECGANLFTLSPAQAVARISPRPVLIVHGEDDRVVPLAQGRRVHAAARAPRELVTIPGAGHLETVFVDSAHYARRMLGFLDRAIDDQSRP